jgi:hypothetical protein
MKGKKMRSLLKTKLFAILLLISLTIAQGFVAHASQTMYKTLTENNNYAEFMLSDYLRYCP